MSSAHDDLTIPARDGFRLSGHLFQPASPTSRVVVVNSATAVPKRFYRHFAARLARAGYHVVTYDYRGIGGSRPEQLRGFLAHMRDWALLDMAGVADWASAELRPKKLFFVGHSVGGQVAGLLDDLPPLDGMVTFSSQSGHWRLQGAEQKAVVAFHVHVTMPLLANVMGYVPWSRFGSGEDLPKGAALEWSRWCRHPDYLLGDRSLPLERYQTFQAPVLAYSFADDKWGTETAVNAMMRAYPNLERRHVVPSAVGMSAIGHFGYFRPPAERLWDEPIAWLDAH